MNTMASFSSHQLLLPQQRVKTAEPHATLWHHVSLQPESFHLSSWQTSCFCPSYPGLTLTRSKTACENSPVGESQLSQWPRVHTGTDCTQLLPDRRHRGSSVEIRTSGTKWWSGSAQKTIEPAPFDFSFRYLLFFFPSILWKERPVWDLQVVVFSNPCTSRQFVFKIQTGSGQTTTTIKIKNVHAWDSCWQSSLYVCLEHAVSHPAHLLNLVSLCSRSDCA